MPGNITHFAFDDALVRAQVDEHGNPWFVAKDVCRVLELGNVTEATRNLDEDERCSVILNTLGGNQEMITISESGLYSLIFRSRKPEAKRFRKWVTGEVLPTLRRTGTYTLLNTKLEPVAELPSRSSLDVILKGLQTEIAGIPRRQVEKGINYALQMARVVGVMDPDELAGAIVESCRLMNGRGSVGGRADCPVFPGSIDNVEASLVREFVETACEFNSSYECGSHKLWLAFRAWCKDMHGIAEKSCITNKAMSIVLTGMGIRRKRIRPSTIFTGILPAEAWRHA